MRDHLNRSLGLDGVIAEARTSKPTSFLSHPLPECSCRASKQADILSPVKGPKGEVLHGGEGQCPEWMIRGLAMVIPKPTGTKDEGAEENEPPEDYPDAEGQLDLSDEGARNDATRPSEQDEEMDPDD